MKLVKTGINKLDEMLGGGIPKKASITISGPGGSGKTILATQFLVNGARMFAEPGLYISLEEDKETYLTSISNFNFKINALMSEGLFMVVDMPPHEVSQLVDIRNPVKELIEEFGISRVVIDSIMPLAIAYNTDVERQRGFLQLIQNIRKWDTTTIIISEDTRQRNEVLPSTKYGIENLTQGWIHLYYEKKKTGQRERLLEIIKLKGMKHSSKAARFKITEDGIVFK